MKPSIELNEPWLYSCLEKENSAYDPTQTGKWMIFPSRKNVDEYWQRICDAALVAKVSTVGGNADAYQNHVICVYANLNEKEHIRDKLREIGFTKNLPWKLDEATFQNEYGPRTQHLVEEGKMISKPRARKKD